MVVLDIWLLTVKKPDSTDRRALCCGALFFDEFQFTWMEAEFSEIAVDIEADRDAERILGVGRADRSDHVEKRRRGA